LNATHSGAVPRYGTWASKDPSPSEAYEARAGAARGPFWTTPRNEPTPATAALFLERLLQLHRNGSGYPADQAHHGGDDEGCHFYVHREQTIQSSFGSLSRAILDEKRNG
jgi:hypothetical protein